MAIYKYPTFKIIIDAESKKKQGLKQGDIVRRQYVDSPRTVYSLMVVLETGVDLIGEKESSFFIGGLLEGDAPQTGEILNFVRVTNLFDTDRSGAIYLTSSDAESPYMDVIDGMGYEQSLCFPSMTGGKPEKPDRNKYSCIGTSYFESTYINKDAEASRIIRLERNDTLNIGDETIGLKQNIEGVVGHPDRILISYKVKGSKSKSGIPIRFGYLNDAEIDGNDTIDITTNWSYKLHVINIDFPPLYQRCFTIDLSDFLDVENDWCEIADFNIIRQSDIATFSKATKARVGKIKGIVDPVFGVLEGYGAYFQNLYATKNVNIAGTLTAGDQNGFSSTFYVGKIHKNVIVNSIDVTFKVPQPMTIMDDYPTGIGKAWLLDTNSKMVVQSSEWRSLHAEQTYCFSFWAKSNQETNLTIYQDEYHVAEVLIDSPEWKRYHVSVDIKESLLPEMIIEFVSDQPHYIISSPQFEYGKTPSQYQPTDQKLSYTEDYGAWFSKGGIGGTIQNPLLKLNDDGSISSQDDSFVINQDGSGHFADGRFRWTKDKILLEDVSIEWETPITVEIVSQSGFVVQNNQNDVDAKAILYKNGKEIDDDGTVYNYFWKLWDSTGKTVLREYEGKKIIVSREDIIDRGSLWCEVESISY